MKTYRAAFDQSVKADPQKRMDSFRIQTAEIGVVDIHQGNFLTVGEVETDGVDRPTLTVGFSGCRCGCGAPGTAILYTPPIDRLRWIAAKLTSLADAYEADADRLATAALAKAKRR